MKKLIKTVAVVLFILICLFVILVKAQEKTTIPAASSAASSNNLTPSEQAELIQALKEERDRAKDLEIARARAGEAEAARVAIVRGFYAEHGFKLSTHDLKPDKEGVWGFVEKVKAKP